MNTVVLPVGDSDDVLQAIPDLIGFWSMARLTGATMEEICLFSQGALFGEPDMIKELSRLVYESGRYEDPPHFFEAVRADAGDECTRLDHVDFVQGQYARSAGIYLALKRELGINPSTWKEQVLKNGPKLYYAG